MHHVSMRAGLERASLFFAVFVSGAVLLAVEIVSSRVLAPFFGNSLYVWGALIGVVLSGLAIGYWLGGALADRLPDVHLLLAVMTVGALLVLAIPYADDHVLRWIVEWDPGARLNPLLASIILFGPPSVVLATVTPVAVRIAARSVATLGRTAGRLFAVSTVGSIVGTFATAFVLIPELGSNQLLAYASCSLLAGTAVVAGARGRLPSAAAAAAAAGVAAVLAVGLGLDQSGRLEGAAAGNFSPIYRLRGGTAEAPDFKGEGLRVLYRKESAYHSIAVVQDESTRYLRFDSSYQSGMRRARPFETPFEYVDDFALGLAYHPSARNVLFIGLGGGSAPKRFWRDFPNLRLQVVELDPVVRDVAYRWFQLPRDRRLTVDVEDGRTFLERDHRRWDVIALDAYYSDSIPFHLATREFVQLVRERLAPGGVVVANVIGSLRGSQSKLFRSFYRTYRSVFPSVAVHPVDYFRSRELDLAQNVMLVAGEFPVPGRAFLLRRWRELRRREAHAVDLTNAVRRRYEAFVPTQDVPVLTDDYAPTDSLLLVD